MHCLITLSLLRSRVQVLLKSCGAPLWSTTDPLTNISSSLWCSLFSACVLDTFQYTIFKTLSTKLLITSKTSSFKSLSVLFEFIFTSGRSNGNGGCLHFCLCVGMVYTTQHHLYTSQWQAIVRGSGDVLFLGYFCGGARISVGI